MSIVESGALAPAWASTGAAELVDDHALILAMLRVETALAAAQNDVGLIPESSLRAIEVAARSQNVDPVSLARGVRDTGNPVVSLVAQLTAAVEEVDPSAADHVHLGSTSQDVLDTAIALLSADALDHVSRCLTRCGAHLAALAVAHRTTPMVGRTLTQHAVPITFGLKLAVWLAGVIDARDAVDVARAALPVSLGGAGGTLGAYLEWARVTPTCADPVAATLSLSSHMSEALGLADQTVPWHGRRAPFATVGYALALTTGSLGKMATDVLLMARPEIGELHEAPAVGRGISSAMPQKRNPVLATLVATAARQLPGLLVPVHAAMAASDDERGAGSWHAEWQPLREALRVAGGAAGNALELVRCLEVSPARMTANLELTGAAVMSERLAVHAARTMGRRRSKDVLAAATHAATTSAEAPTMMELVAAIETAEVGAEVPDDLGNPADYVGLAAELVDRVLRDERLGELGASVAE